MPDRVKCLHVLVAHALAAGPGVNPLGDEALELLGEWWQPGPASTRRTRMTRVAAVDCGTNSLRLLVADLDADAGARGQVERRTTIVRLGQGVDRTGVFAPQALERTFARLEEYAALIGTT